MAETATAESNFLSGEIGQLVTWGIDKAIEYQRASNPIVQVQEQADNPVYVRNDENNTVRAGTTGFIEQLSSNPLAILAIAGALTFIIWKVAR